MRYQLGRCTSASPSMEIFPTGATGLIGRRVVPPIVAAGHAVTAVARAGAKSHRLQQAGAHPIDGSLFDTSALARAVAGHDAVINLATHMPSLSLRRCCRAH